MTFTLDIIKHKRHHSYTWLHYNAREKIDPNGLEIIVSYLECRWIFFLFPPACLLWLFCFCAFAEGSKSLGKKDIHKSMTYKSWFSLKACILIQLCDYYLLFNRHQSCFDIVAQLSFASDLPFYCWLQSYHCGQTRSCSHICGPCNSSVVGKQPRELLKSIVALLFMCTRGRYECVGYS